MSIIEGGRDRGTGWKEQLSIRYSGGRNIIAPTATNAIIVLRHDFRWRQEGGLPRLRKNLLTNVIEVTYPPWAELEAGLETMAESHQRAWRETDYILLHDWFLRDPYAMNFGMDRIKDIVSAAAQWNGYHPIREWLDTLSWDKQPRISTWLHDFLGAEKTSYSGLVGRMFLISAIARVLNPGCQADAMPVLEGAQGIGKSSALGVLFRPWFSDAHLDLDSKDSLIALRGCWGIEWAELSALRKADIERVKTFISQRVNRYRPPFERIEVEEPRQCIFIGTTNRSAYLQDEENRRFWPVKVRKIDLTALDRARHQLWAEAMQAYHDGEKWHPTQEESLGLFSPEQESRRVADPWEELIIGFVDLRQEITTAEILEHLGVPTEKQSTPEARRVAEIMRKNGWENYRKGAIRGFRRLPP